MSLEYLKLGNAQNLILIYNAVKFLLTKRCHSLRQNIIDQVFAPVLGED